MTAGNDFDPDPAHAELFSALLTPHRSLSRAGFLVLMAFLSFVSFAAGLAFWLMGAWPVLGFFGLDVLAVYLAFRINFRHARASEEIRITPSELRLRRVSHRGHVVVFVLNPLCVQLDQKMHANTASKNSICSRKAAASRSQAFWGRTKKQALPKP